MVRFYVSGCCVSLCSYNPDLSMCLVIWSYWKRKLLQFTCPYQVVWLLRFVPITTSLVIFCQISVCMLLLIISFSHYLSLHWERPWSDMSRSRCILSTFSYIIHFLLLGSWLPALRKHNSLEFWSLVRFRPFLAHNVM